MRFDWGLFVFHSSFGLVFDTSDADSFYPDASIVRHVYELYLIRNHPALLKAAYTLLICATGEPSSILGIYYIECCRLYYITLYW